MQEADNADRTTYAPLILFGSGQSATLLLVDDAMPDKCHIFEEREGWLGNGYDWNSVAQVVVAEQLPDLSNEVSFDPEAGMFVARGPRGAVERLASAMCAVFHDDDKIRDLLSRAELD
jgi:hypothetical protein